MICLINQSWTFHGKFLSVMLATQVHLAMFRLSAPHLIFGISWWKSGQQINTWNLYIYKLNPNQIWGWFDMRFKVDSYKSVWVRLLIADFRVSFVSFATQHTTTTSKHISSRTESMRSLTERVNILWTVRLKLIVCSTAWWCDCLKSELMDEWFHMLPCWKHT